jgi:hypothetical protein
VDFYGGGKGTRHPTTNPTTNKPTGEDRYTCPEALHQLLLLQMVDIACRSLGGQRWVAGRVVVVLAMMKRCFRLSLPLRNVQLEGRSCIWRAASDSSGIGCGCSLLCAHFYCPVQTVRDGSSDVGPSQEHIAATRFMLDHVPQWGRNP